MSGFYKLSVADRIAQLAQMGYLTAGQASNLAAGRHILAAQRADSIIENVIGVFALPFAVAPNFVCNGRDYLVPLVVEEPSIVAALSSAAALARDSGGFAAQCEESLLLGQVHLTGIANIEQAVDALTAAHDELLGLANDVHPRLVQRGGGAKDIEVHCHQLGDGERVIALHILVDTCDAMGANLVNTICEAIAPRVAQISGGEVALRILSNLADRSLVRARVRYSTESLATNESSGVQVRDAIVLANDIALVDAYRAATHNKGIMNGIDPFLIATGNDWRAVEAGAHAYAARDGKYRALTHWRVGNDGALEGELALPLKVGTVGGTLSSNPSAALGLALTGTSSAKELSELMAVVGLAQNFAAIRALATSGIQRGHMRLHARSLAAAAGANDEDIDEVAARLVVSGEVKDWKASEIVAAMVSDSMPEDAASAAGKIILFGEHAVVYGSHALALPIPHAVRAVATENATTTCLRIHEWNLNTTLDADNAIGAGAIVGTILAALGCAERNFTIDVSSRLPRGKGLGSSAAIAVAVTRAVARSIGADIDNIRVNEIAFACEQQMHGTPSGVDNTLSCYGEPILFRRGDELMADAVQLTEVPPLVIGIGHSAGATDRMVAGVRERRKLSRSHYDDLFSKMNALALAGHDALRRGECGHRELGRLMNVCHGLLNAIGVSTAELETMLEIARDNGALGAKLTGAGGGGAIVALCPGTQGQVRSALREAGFATLDIREPEHE